MIFIVTYKNIFPSKKYHKAIYHENSSDTDVNIKVKNFVLGKAMTFLFSGEKLFNIVKNVNFMSRLQIRRGKKFMIISLLQ